MRSIGLFVKKNADATSGKDRAIDLCGMEIHINLWNVRTRGGLDFYAIDFGLKYSKDVDSLKLALPFEAKKEDFLDLAHVLTNNKSLLCTVFNADMNISSEQSDSIHDVVNIDSGEKMSIYELSVRNLEWKEFDPESNSTELLITPHYKKDSVKADNVYVRFRIRLHDINMFAHTRKLSNDLIQSAFSSTRLFDIRLNDKREIDKKLIEGVLYEGFQMVKIEKMHFFYMADAEETLENGSNISLDTRMLEKEKWNPYLEETEMSAEYLAYHWKLKRRENDKPLYSTFSVFFKTNYTSYDIKRILKYTMIVVLLSFFGSLLVRMFDWFDKDFYFCIGIISLFIFGVYCWILKSSYEGSTRS